MDNLRRTRFVLKLKEIEGPVPNFILPITPSVLMINEFDEKKIMENVLGPSDEEFNKIYHFENTGYDQIYPT